MALTKQDINQIGGLLDKQTKAFDKKLEKQTKTLRKEFKSDLQQQTKAFDKKLEQVATKDDIRALGQQISRGFADQTELMKNTYASNHFDA